MVKLRLFLLMTLYVTSTAQADVDFNFTGAKEPSEVNEAIQCKGDVTIVNNGSNTVLRMNTKNSSSTSNFFFPTKLKGANNFTASFDYMANRHGIAGMIFRLGDWSQNKIFLDIRAEGDRFSVSTFIGKRYKRKPLCKIDKKVWYNFKLTVKGKNFSVVITEKGADNASGQEKVVYDSERQHNIFRANPEVKPLIGSMNQWPGQGRDLTFFYDNITVASK